VILVPILALTFLGCQRGGRIGLVVAMALSLICCWIAALTCGVKLIPSYGGLLGRVTFGRLRDWWTGNVNAALDGIIMVPMPWLIGLLLLTVALLCAVNLLLIRQFLTVETTRPHAVE
jgi:hypothetical protein